MRFQRARRVLWTIATLIWGFLLFVVGAAMISPAHAQMMVPAPAKPAGKGERCIPGIYGTPWPGARFDLGTRTDNGWFSYVWCKSPITEGLVYIARVCVHGECAPQTTYWQTAGQLLVQAITGKSRADTAEDYIVANPLAYACPIYPSGAQPPAQPASGAQFPPVASKRADICAELLVAMRADWPVVPVPPPPPPPVGLSPYIVTKGLPRPAYMVLNGKRSTSPNGAAVPGEPCDCAALQIIEFNVARYCASPSITGITGAAVTACSPRPK